MSYVPSDPYTRLAELDRCSAAGRALIPAWSARIQRLGLATPDTVEVAVDALRAWVLWVARLGVGAEVTVSAVMWPSEPQSLTDPHRLAPGKGFSSPLMQAVLLGTLAGLFRIDGPRFYTQLPGPDFLPALALLSGEPPPTGPTPDSSTGADAP